VCVVEIHISHAHPRGDFRSCIHQEDVWRRPETCSEHRLDYRTNVLAYETAICARTEGAEKPLAFERAATRGAVFALKSALTMDEFWAGKWTRRGADEVQSYSLINMLCDGAPKGVQEGV